MPNLPNFGDAVFLQTLKAAGGDVGAVMGALEGDLIDGGVGAVAGDWESFALAGDGEDAAAGGFERV